MFSARNLDFVQHEQYAKELSTTGQNFVPTTSALKIYKTHILKDPTPNCLCSAVFVLDKVSCSPSWLQTHIAGLEFLILWLPAPKGWDYSMYNPHLSLSCFS